MIRRNELYECDHCGNIVEVVRGEGPGPSIRCCDQAMTFHAECDLDLEEERHESVEAEVSGGILVMVGDGGGSMNDEEIMVWVEMA